MSSDRTDSIHSLSPAASALLTLMLASAPLAAQDRALLTEPATTAPRGTTVIETGFEVMAEEPNFLTHETRTRWAGPLIRVVHSPADNVELDLEWVAATGVWRDPKFGDVADWGDVTLRAKWRIVDQAPGRPSLAARFEVSLPETKADRGLGPNTLRMSAQMLLSETRGRFTGHLNAGLAIQDKVVRGAEQRDFFHYGLAGEVLLDRGWTVIGEINGLAGAESPGTESHAEWRIGARLRLGPVTTAAVVRRGITHADGRWGVAIGLSYEVRPR